MELSADAAEAVQVANDLRGRVEAARARWDDARKAASAAEADYYRLLTQLDAARRKIVSL